MDKRDSAEPGVLQEVWSAVVWCGVVSCRVVSLMQLSLFCACHVSFVRHTTLKLSAVARRSVYGVGIFGIVGACLSNGVHPRFNLCAVPCTLSSVSTLFGMPRVLADCRVITAHVLFVFPAVPCRYRGIASCWMRPTLSKTGRPQPQRPCSH